MPRCVVLLRGVNVGGHNRIAMAAFRDVLTRCGCTDVATHLQANLLNGKRFPVIASARNWRTVLALQELTRG